MLPLTLIAHIFLGVRVSLNFATFWYRTFLLVSLVLYSLQSITTGACFSKLVRNTVKFVYVTIDVILCTNTVVTAQRELSSLNSRVNYMHKFFIQSVAKCCLSSTKFSHDNQLIHACRNLPIFSTVCVVRTSQKF